LTPIILREEGAGIGTPNHLYPKERHEKNQSRPVLVEAVLFSVADQKKIGGSHLFVKKMNKLVCGDPEMAPGAILNNKGKRIKEVALLTGRNRSYIVAI
jgi:hypothetical protein